MADTTPSPLDRHTLLEYQAILENASVGIVFTRHQHVLHCNRRCSEIFGWPHGELVGQHGSVFYTSPEEYARVGREASPLLAQGQLFDQEMPMRRKDGGVVYCHIRAKAIDPANTAEGTIWIVEDVGERHRAEAQIQDLLLKQQAILENASIGIAFTHNGVIVHCNPRMEAIFGWPPGGLIGRRSEVFFRNTEDYQAFGRQVGPLLARGELVDIEWLNVKQDGTALWSRHLAKAIPNLDEGLGAIWISEDITKRKAIEEALHEAQRQLEQRVLERTAELEKAHQQLDAMIQCAPLAIYTRDPQSVITSWNPAAEQMFGWSAEEVVGRQIPSVPSDQLEEHEALVRRVLAGETLMQIEVVRLRRDGKRIYLNMTVAPMRDSAGCITGYLTIAADISERKEAEQRIEFLAYHDVLTGLPNRLLLRDRVDQAMAHAERHRKHMALLFMDLDNFKQINDTLGHDSGDQLLREVTQRIRHCIRDTDTVSRQGGDEFVILLPDLTDAQAAVPVLDKLMEQMQRPFVLDGNELSTSMSVGVAVYPEDGRTFDALLKKADMAMYQAKENGRATYHFFNDAMSHRASEHLALRNGLRRALDHGELELYYQPQVDLASGCITGAEALLRWNAPGDGLIMPGRFIPVAEESGLIVPIGEWVIMEACRQASAWRRAGLPELCVAINLSAVQFRRGNVEQTVLRALESTGLPPHCLELELTESIMIQSLEQVLATVRRLKLLGVKLSIDDFGTGYSSLSYLKRFDVDKLKIDQSFVRDLATDPDDAAIVRAIVQMARSLNLKTIAEGVETEDMRHMLRVFQCDEAQGYLFAHPMGAEAFARFLSERSGV
ncbi:EAL domain-containing protein [Tepidicella baoligensis]|uniref:EAL domain-containing protein n=1 Tax=Tepidicella baoligensis TaxID=2707016 RepID=UPI0015DB17DA